MLIHNFFPTETGADIVKSREIASQKMFLIHNALGEDAKIFDPDEEPTASGLFTKINSLPEDEGELNTITKVRNELKQIKEEHPETIDRVSNFPNRTKTAKYHSEQNTVVLRKKGMALFSVVARDKDGMIDIKENTFEELLDHTVCGYDEERLKIDSTFWSTYEKLKAFSPTYKSGRSEIALESKAINSLKSLLKQRRDELNQPLVAFIDILIKDIRKYKTLPKFTLRKLIFPDNLKNDPYTDLITQIENLRKRLGNDYLDKLLNRVANINDDVIIAVDNKIQNEMK